MKRSLQILFALFFIFIASSKLLVAQNNLSVAFENLNAVPDFLNICGDADTAKVVISIEGLNPFTRTNLTATANLFEGVNFVEFLPAQSSTGITLVDGSDPSRPIFSLPDLGPSGILSVELTYSIVAKCAYIDTLTANNAADVLDAWHFEYDLDGSTTGLVEDDVNIEYRDAFAVPSFTISAMNSNGPSKVGECLSRDIITTNSGLDGFVDTLMYENIQGAGISVVGIEVNGISIPFTKQEVFGDTLITALIDSSFFQLNTIGSGPGDGDNFFDPDETVLITEYICVLNCDDSRASTHTALWGCDGDYCRPTTTTDFIRIGDGAANVGFVPSGSVTNTNTGYCQAGSSTVTFTNEGVEVDPGFATMTDLIAGIGIGDGFLLSSDGFTITSIVIGGVTMTAPLAMNPLDGNPLFQTDPDGPGGIEDMDGDGYFDDLGLGQSFEMTAYFEFDCSNAQVVGDDYCANDFVTALSARVDYTDACSDQIIELESSYYAPQNKQDNFENFTDPDAFLQTDVFYIIHNETRSVFNFEKDCGSGEQFIIKMVLPTGINPIISEMALFRNQSSSSVPLINNFMTGDTLNLIYDASVSAFIGGEYEVIMALQADCSAQTGPTSFPFSMEHYCPSCDCTHTWYCDELPGPQLHTTDPPCPPLACPVGLQSTSFDVNRVTFGYTDNSYTTPYDPALANTKVAISCDSIEMRLINIVGDTPISDSIGVVVHYNNVDGSMDTTQTLIFGEGTLRLTNNGNEYFCPIDQSHLTVQAIDSTKFLTFELGNCLTDLGITLNPGDTVEYIGYFKVNTEGPYPVQFRRIPNLRAYGYAAVDGIDYACDNFGDILTIAKNNTVFSYPNSTSMPEGCEEATLQYRLITVNNGFSEWFGNEYRQAIAIDSITFRFDTTIFQAFSQFIPEVSIPGHPVHGNSFVPIESFDLSPDGYYVARFDTLQNVPALNDVTSYSFNLRIRAIPNCRSLTGSINDDNVFDFDPTIYFYDRYYASVIGDGSCIDYKVDSVDNNITYTEPPTFILSPVSNPNFILVGDTAVWEVQYCNTSSEADAGLTWLSLEDATGAIEIVEMTDISNPSNNTDLTITQYDAANGSYYFAYTPALLRADGTNNLDEMCNTIRIKSLVNNCGLTNITARIGYNCIAFDDPNWTPLSYDPCDDITTPLTVTTLSPFLDATITEQPATNPEICDTSTIEILVRNTNEGIAYDIRTQLILPIQGATIVPGSIQFAHPSDAPMVPALSDPVYVGTSSRGDIYQYDDFSQLDAFLDQNGLPGFDPSNPTTSNEIRLRYDFVTDCNYVSGSVSYYTIQGMQGCGDSTNFERGETLPIQINGAEPDFSKIFDISFSPQTALFPGGVSTVGIDVTNMTSTPSDTTDKVKLMLPLEVVYQPGSTVATNPGTWILEEPEIDTVANFQMLYWCLPAGILQNEVANFTFGLAAPDYDCSTSNLEVGLSTILRKELMCVGTTITCEVEAITSIDGSQLTDLPVIQNSLDFHLASVTSICQDTNEELVTVDGGIINAGVDFPALPFTVTYHFDSNSNDIYDDGEPVIMSFNESGPIGSLDTLPINHSFFIDNGKVCQIIARIDTTGLGLCDESEIKLPDPVLLNAGDDQLFCADSPTTINTEIGDPACNFMGGYVYNWRALPPAADTDLSSLTVPNPTISVPHNAVVEDTLIYVLETQRVGCGALTVDSVLIIRGISIDVVGGGDVFSTPGDTITLMPTVTGGSTPYTYSWTPTTDMDDPTSATPQVWPSVETQYTVTATSAVGCTDTDVIQVFFSNPVEAVLETADTSICSNETVQLGVTGGTDYSWVEDAANPTMGNLSSTTIPNPIFSGAAPNSIYMYDVIVTDTNYPGYADTATVTITVDDALAEALAFPPIACAGDTVVLSGGYGIQLDWFEGTTPIGSGFSLVVMPTATTTYTLVAENAIGCQDTAMVTVQVEPLPIVANPIPDMENCASDVIPVSIEINEPIASYIIAGTGGFANDFISGGNTLNFDAIYTGDVSTFDVYITGATNGCEIVETFTISSCTSCNTPVVAGVSTTSSTCGNAEGSAVITVAGDPNLYSFDWAPNSGTIVSPGNASENLPFGGYIVTIADIAQANCNTEAYVLITNADGPTASAVTTPATCEAPDGTATLSPANFTYEWSDGGNGNSRTDLTTGVYFVTLTDPADPACPNAMMVIIDEYNPLVAEVVINQQPDCGVANGSVTINITGGSGNYSYSWASGTDTNTDMAAGAYLVTVRDNGPTGCELPVIFVLTDDVPQGTVTITDTMHVTCAGLQDGGVDYDIVFDPAFTNPPDTFFTNTYANFENDQFPAGSYCVVINDGNACVAGGACFTIESPDPLNLLFENTDDCVGGGAIDLTVTGGTPPYSYDWADLTPTSDPEDRLGLSQGNYSITVTDANGCTLDANTEVRPCTDCIPATVSSTSIVQATCGNSDGAATVNVEGDEADYSYVWTPTLGTPNAIGNTQTNIPFGAYTIQITNNDDPSCVTETTLIVTNSDGPTPDIVTTPATCDAADGTATLTPNFYNYTWSDGGSGATRNDLATGVYIITLTDPLLPDCPNVAEVFVDQDNPLLADVVINQQPDCGVANGSVTINVSGGTGPYTYSWPSGTDTQTGLTAGIYVVTVTESDPVTNCELPVIFILTDDVPPATTTITDTIDISCFGLIDGGIEYDIVFDPAFTNPSDTIISNGFNNFTNGNLPAGNYCLQIDDGNGCVAGGGCFTIEEPEQMELTFVVTSACSPGIGAIDLSITGGVAPFTIDWGDMAGTDNNEDRFSLDEGTYDITVTDARGCVMSDQVVVDQQGCPCEVEITSTAIVEATCGNADGAITIEVEGDEANYSYTWIPDVGQSIGSGNGQINVPFGGYLITVVDNNDPACSSEIYATVTNSNGPTATVVTGPATCDAPDGTATLSPDTFNYVWSDNGSTSATRDDLPSGTYFVTLTDPADPDCPNVLEVIIGEDNPLVADIIVNAQPDCGVCNGSVTINVSGGSGDYSFSWPSGVDTQDGLCAGIYVVTVTDNDPVTNCQLPVIFVLTDNVPEAAITITDTLDVSCAGGANGGVEYDIVFDPAFTPPADTTFSNGFGIFENYNLPAGDYCMMVRDGNACVAGGACFRIEEPDPLHLEFAVTSACEPGIGAIDLTVTGGTAPFMIDWEDIGAANDAEDRTDLDQGIYTVSVTDANGCVLVGQAEVSDVGCNCVEPVLTSVAIIEATCGNTDGTVIISVEGDESNYVYSFTPDLGIAVGAGNSHTNMPFGAYTVTVADATNPSCSIELDVLLTNSDGPTAEAFTTPATCAVADGTASMTPDTYAYEWSDGGSGAIRNDLFTGTYSVTLTDPANPDCSNVMQVLIDQDTPLIADIVVNDQPDCGVANGSVTINISGGSGNYSYSWASGTDTNTGMASGIYVVTVTDNDGSGCELPVIFVLTDDVPPATVTITDTMNVSCAGEADGGVLYDITFDPAFTNPADTILSNGFNNFTNGNLPAGDYCYAINDGNGCVAGGACFSIEEPDPLALQFVIVPACENGGSIDVSVSGGTAPYAYDWADLPDGEDTEDRMNLTIGDYSLTVVDTNNCTIVEDLVNIPSCPSDDCDYFNGHDSLYLQAMDCLSFAELCVDIPLQDVNGYEVYDNGVLYTDYGECNFDTLFAYAYSELFGKGTLGPYEVTSWTINDSLYTGEFETIPDLVDSMNVWDPMGNWTISDVGLFIVGGNASNSYSELVINALNFGTTSVIAFNLRLTPLGFSIQLDLGAHEVIVRDTLTGCTDTLIANVVCTTTDTITTTINVTQVDTLCFETTELIGELDTLFNACPVDNVTYEVYNDSCIIITGIEAGIDTLCIVLCDDVGICDTNTVIVTVLDPLNPIVDTIFVNQIDTFCVDTSLLNIEGTLVSMENVCEELSGVFVEFTLDETDVCIIYEGLTIGTDTACIAFCDDLGICDTIDVYVTVIPNPISPDYVYDTIFINQTDTFCIDTSQLVGEVVSIENFCPEDGGDDVSFNILVDTLCLEYTGIQEGKDTACIEICDEFGFCDTTFFCIWVVEFEDPPVAVDDVDTTALGTPVVIDIKANDTFFGSQDTAYILEEPEYGTAFLNPDCSVTYTAGEEYCERLDEFSYVICNHAGCDTASVYVFIECIDIVIFNAVSPNRDGVNDVFFISGIEDYPESRLSIFNRWGNKVYETIGYMNDWQGTWDGNKDLPDGTYFYILELNDTDDRVFKGFLEIYR